MIAPTDVDLVANMREASQRYSLSWFHRQVRRRGPWDFRMRNEAYRAFGNFHYGAVAAAMGIPDWLTLRAAGWEHWWTGGTRSDMGKPWGYWPYGDAPEDASNIQAGIEHAQKVGFRVGLGYRLRWRLFDVVFSMLWLLLTGPLALLMAALVVLASGWPPFDGSWRLERFGKPFRCWKIRTLRLDHERILREHLGRHPEAMQQWERYAKLPEDPRATWIGRWLRKTSLDDLLTQGWNILRGEMAVFGPRPFLVREEPRLGKYRDAILSVTPGWVSYYGAYGRASMPFQDRVKLDAEYASEMHRWSVKWRALKGTAWHCLTGKGAG